MSKDEPYALGIDVGTTSIKVLVLNCKQEVVCSCSQKSFAEIDSDVGHLGFEQDPHKIVQALLKCISEIPEKDQSRVAGISVTGQMHGVMLWRSSDITQSHKPLPQPKTSPLYSWMDQRCTPEFLASLPTPSSHLQLATGHGCATLFWLARHQGEIIHDRGYDCAGSVMDYVVASLCGLARPVTSVQIAASMGYFNTQEKSWNIDLLSSSGFPIHLLPGVVSPGDIAGRLRSSLSHIPSNIPVYVAMGDVQCAFLSVIKHPQDAVMNLSTSIQIGYVSKGSKSSSSKWLEDKPPTVEYFPYFDGDYLALSAGLNGGNVLQHFVSTMQNWMQEFGLTLSDSEVWSKLLSMAERSSDPTLSVTPTLYGERHQPSLQGSVKGITPSNTSLGAVFKATCYGVIDNLSSLMSSQFLTESGGVKRLLASGSVITHNPILRERLETVYRDIQIFYGNSGDSALGAAKVVKLL